MSHAVIIGAGVAGLNAALALHAKGFRVTILERDPAPPPDAEMDWRRRGVPHSVHPHFFMGRLRKLFVDRHPRLLERLRAAGVEERPFEEYLHRWNREAYRPEAIDSVLTALSARRTTFERLVRQHVEEEGFATLVSDANVTGLVLEGSKPIRVRGVEAEVGGEPRVFDADLVIDASGRTGRLAETLESAGASFEVEQHDCRLLYFTRCYRLLAGQQFPPVAGLPGYIFPDFVVGALQGDNGAFTVTLQVHDGDVEFMKLAKDPQRFQALCEKLPCVAAWVSPERSVALGGVHGFGLMDAFWRKTVHQGKPEVVGFFFVGDTAVRSNPKFGRGCTWGAVAAHLLADILAAVEDPAERVIRYERMLEDEFRADWRTMLANDRSMRRQYEIAAGLRSPTVADRVTRKIESVVTRALVVDPIVFRAIWAGYHGVTGMAAWTRRIGIWLRLLRMAAFGPGKFRAVLEPMRFRPSRQEIFAIQPTGGRS